MRSYQHTNANVDVVEPESLGSAGNASRFRVRRLVGLGCLAAGCLLVGIVALQATVLFTSAHHSSLMLHSYAAPLEVEGWSPRQVKEVSHHESLQDGCEATIMSECPCNNLFVTSASSSPVSPFNKRPTNIVGFQSFVTVKRGI